jgi:Zn-dependent peptidase ImmA (M78 family)
MPADILRSEVGNHRHYISLGELFQLKAIFEVSVQALAYRCQDLGIIDNALYQQLMEVFKEQSRHHPPDRESLPLEPVGSDRIRALVLSGFSRKCHIRGKGC